MRKKYVQMSLLDTYHRVEERLEHDKPELFKLLDEHLDWEEFLPNTFFCAFINALVESADMRWKTSCAPCFFNDFSITLRAYNYSPLCVSAVKCVTIANFLRFPTPRSSRVSSRISAAISASFMNGLWI